MRVGRRSDDSMPASLRGASRGGDSRERVLADLDEALPRLRVDMA
jgi:hypothetical protein